MKLAIKVICVLMVAAAFFLVGCANTTRESARDRANEAMNYLMDGNNDRFIRMFNSEGRRLISLEVLEEVNAFIYETVGARESFEQVTNWGHYRDYFPNSFVVEHANGRVAYHIYINTSGRIAFFDVQVLTDDYYFARAVVVYTMRRQSIIQTSNTLTAMGEDAANNFGYEVYTEQ